MIWVFSVVCVVLVAVIAEMLLVFQKRSSELRLRQEPMRKRIKAHTESIQESATKIHRAATQRKMDIQRQIELIRGKIDKVDKPLRELEQASYGEVVEEITDVDTAVQEARVDDSAEERRREELRAKLREARSQRELIDSHLNSMAKEVEIVERLVERLEAKVPIKGLEKRNRT